MHFKGIRVSFEILEWNFRDIGIQKVLDFGGNLFNMIYGLRDTFQNNFRDTG